MLRLSHNRGLIGARTLSKERHFLLCTFRKAIGNCMCHISLMHRVVQYRAEFHAFQEILPCTIPPCALNLFDTPNLLAYMHNKEIPLFLQCHDQESDWSVGGPLFHFACHSLGSLSDQLDHSIWYNYMVL